MLVAFMIQTIILISVILFAIVKLSKLKNIKEELVQMKEENDSNQEPPSDTNLPKQKNVRKHHRVKLKSPIPCTITFMDFGTDKLNQLKGKTIESTIFDVSLGGLRLREKIDLPVQFEITAEIGFTFEDHSFNLPCEFIRKHVSMGTSKFTYGVHFLQLTRKDEHMLALLINQFETKKKRNLRTSALPLK